MILTTLRIMENGIVETPMTCENKDFNTAIEIVKTLIPHATKIFESLPVEVKTPKQNNRKHKFLDALPSEFNRQTYLATAQTQNIPPKTAEKMITKFVQTGLIKHLARDKYSKH
jgi:hypothetical protein